jgi:sugar-specific transcriptional regulator TrmB
MRSYNELHAAHAEKLNEAKRMQADKERLTLLSAIKNVYGVSNFNALSESDKCVYRNMINEMWNKETGLNEKGVKFVNESEVSLSNNSGTQEVIKYIEQAFRKNLEDYILVALNKKVANNKPVNVRNEVTKLTGKQFKPENFKKIFKDIICGLIDKSDCF